MAVAFPNNPDNMGGKIKGDLQSFEARKDKYSQHIAKLKPVQSRCKTLIILQKPHRWQKILSF